jgi:hypothetical protein
MPWSDAAVIATATGASTIVGGICAVVMRYYFVAKADCEKMQSCKSLDAVDAKAIARSVSDRLAQDEKDYLSREAFQREHTLICDGRSARIEQYFDKQLAGLEIRLMEAIKRAGNGIGK